MRRILAAFAALWLPVTAGPAFTQEAAPKPAHKADGPPALQAYADLPSALGGMHVARRFVFGTRAQVSASGDVPIRGQRDLAASFDPFQTWTGAFSLNGEAQRYQPFGPRTHVFAADRLDLTGSVDRSKYKGGYEVQSATLAKPPETTAHGPQLLWLRDWPALPVDGAAVGYSLPGQPFARADDHRVVSFHAAGKMVAVYPPITAAKLEAGARIRFSAPVVSGQIWSKEQVPLFGGRAGAVQARIVIPPSAALGAWSAVWLYGKNDASVRQHPSKGQEWDLIEHYNDGGARDGLFSGNNHPRDLALLLRMGGSGGWTQLPMAPLYASAPRPMAGEHEVTLVARDGLTLRYWDGVLVKVDRATWENPRDPQIGINLAIGSIGENDALPPLWPRSDAAFKSMRLGVMSVTIYAGE